MVKTLTKIPFSGIVKPQSSIANHQGGESVLWCNVEFSNRLVVPGEVIEATINKVLQMMKSELPEEAQTYEVYNYILEHCKEEIGGKKIIL